MAFMFVKPWMISGRMGVSTRPRGEIAVPVADHPRPADGVVAGRAPAAKTGPVKPRASALRGEVGAEVGREVRLCERPRSWEVSIAVRREVR